MGEQLNKQWYIQYHAILVSSKKEQLLLRHHESPGNYAEKKANPQRLHTVQSIY